jgi:hypothetical protein
VIAVLNRLLGQMNRLANENLVGYGHVIASCKVSIEEIGDWRLGDLSEEFPISNL